MKSMKVKALIFDVDGTLAETEEHHRQAFNQAFQDFGIAWNWDEALYTSLLKIPGGKERIHHYCKVTQSETIDISALHRRKNKIYVARLKGGDIKLRRGVFELIHYARKRGIRLAIASTSSHENVSSLLKATLGSTSLSWFDVMCCGDDVSAKKPDPAIYQLAIDRLQLAPCDCLALEDSHAGLMSALDAALPVVISPSHYTSNHDFTGATFVLKDLSKVLEISLFE